MAKTFPVDVWVLRRVLGTAVLSDNGRFDSEVKWWVHVSSIDKYVLKKSFLFRWNSYKQRSESSTRGCFWATVSKRAPTLNSFLIDKCSCKIGNTLPSDIFNSPAILLNFNLRSANGSFRRFLVFSRTTAEFGRPERSSSFVSVRPRLKSAYLLLTVVSDRAESE